jgi:hypothetical protein
MHVTTTPILPEALNLADRMINLDTATHSGGAISSQKHHLQAQETFEITGMALRIIENHANDTRLQDALISNPGNTEVTIYNLFDDPLTKDQIAQGARKVNELKNDYFNQPRAEISGKASADLAAELTGAEADVGAAKTAFETSRAELIALLAANRPNLEATSGTLTTTSIGTINKILITAQLAAEYTAQLTKLGSVKDMQATHNLMINGNRLAYQKGLENGYGCLSLTGAAIAGYTLRGMELSYPAQIGTALAVGGVFAGLKNQDFLKAIIASASELTKATAITGLSTAVVYGASSYLSGGDALITYGLSLSTAGFVGKSSFDGLSLEMRTRILNLIPEMPSWVNGQNIGTAASLIGNAIQYYNNQELLAEILKLKSN